MESSTIRDMLDEEIVKTLQVVAKTTDMNSDAYKLATAKLKMLHEQRTKELEADLKAREQIDNSMDHADQLHIRQAELDFKVQQAADEQRTKEQEMEIRQEELKEAVKNRRWRTALEILGITVPAGLSCYWMWKGMQFEEEGKIFTSKTGRWLSEHLRLFRK